MGDGRWLTQIHLEVEVEMKVEEKERYERNVKIGQEETKSCKLQNFSLWWNYLE